MQAFLVRSPLPLLPPPSGRSPSAARRHPPLPPPPPSSSWFVDPAVGMRCHAPEEDVEEDDRRFLAAAREDAALAAHLLLRLSRSEACSTPWRQLRDPASSPSAAGAGDHDLPLPDPPKWGQRRPRTRCPTADAVPTENREEAARRSSPTTPLSWSGGGGGGGGSWTSGSVSESTPPHRPPRRRKERDSPSRHDVAQPSSPPVPATPPKPEPDEDWGRGQAPPCEWKAAPAAACQVGSPSAALAAAAPAAAVGSASFPVSTKADAAAAAAAGVPPRAVAHVEPLRPRLTGEGTSSVAVRRPGKKKTVPELKALNESLLQEQVELRKDLEEQKKIFEALLEENSRLKHLEASLGISHRVGEPTVSNRAARRSSESVDPGQPRDARGSGTAAERPDRQALRCTSPHNPEPRRAPPLFDLNCLPDGDADGLL